MYQVGFITRIYRDARSTQHKIPPKFINYQNNTSYQVKYTYYSILYILQHVLAYMYSTLMASSDCVKLLKIVF
jgi:hypothetical protein